MGNKKSGCRLLISDRGSTASGSPLGTILNSVYNLIWTAVGIMAFLYERDGCLSNPFDFFTYKPGGNNGPTLYRQLTYYYQGDDCVGFFNPEMKPFFQFLKN